MRSEISDRRRCKWRKQVKKRLQIQILPHLQLFSDSKSTRLTRFDKVDKVDKVDPRNMIFIDPGFHQIADISWDADFDFLENYICWFKATTPGWATGLNWLAWKNDILIIFVWYFMMYWLAWKNFWSSEILSKIWLVKAMRPSKFVTFVTCEIHLVPSPVFCTEFLFNWFGRILADEKSQNPIFLSTRSCLLLRKELLAVELNLLAYSGNWIYWMNWKNCFNVCLWRRNLSGQFDLLLYCKMFW